jgi:hypothetical protein
LFCFILDFEVLEPFGLPRIGFVDGVGAIVVVASWK